MSNYNEDSLKKTAINFLVMRSEGDNTCFRVHWAHSEGRQWLGVFLGNFDML